jgi:hypothetical protein
MAAGDYRLDMYENIRDMRHEITATHDRKSMERESSSMANIFPYTVQ